jgi:hypothetical protein
MKLGRVVLKKALLLSNLRLPVLLITLSWDAFLHPFFIKNDIKNLLAT